MLKLLIGNGKIYFFTFSPFQLKQSISLDAISIAAASV